MSARSSAATQEPAAGEGCITIACGIPRSGTSLLMQMLVAAGLEPLVDGQRLADESNPRGYFEFAPVKQLPSRGAPWIAQARGRALKVIHALVAQLPPEEHYRVLLIERDLDQVIASQDRMLERLGAAPSALPRERLRAVLRRQLDETRDWLEDAANVQWHAVSHRALIDDSDASARAIARFIGRPEAQAAMAACVEPALHHEGGT